MHQQTLSSFAQVITCYFFYHIFIAFQIEMEKLLVKQASCQEIFWILNKISLKFVPKGLIDNIPTLIQIIALHRPVTKPLS